MNDSIARTAAATAPGVVSVIGLTVPLAPIIIGLSACLLVRLPLIKRKSLVAELCLTGLALLGTCVTIIDHQIAPGSAFWVGISFGAMGSTMIEIGKSTMAGALKERFQNAASVLFGIKTPPNS